jgi:hypothetical protein
MGWKRTVVCGPVHAQVLGGIAAIRKGKNCACVRDCKLQYIAVVIASVEMMGTVWDSEAVELSEYSKELMGKISKNTRGNMWLSRSHIFDPSCGSKLCVLRIPYLNVRT